MNFSTFFSKQFFVIGSFVVTLGWAQQAGAVRFGAEIMTGVSQAKTGSSSSNGLLGYGGGLAIMQSFVGLPLSAEIDALYATRSNSYTATDTTINTAGLLIPAQVKFHMMHLLTLGAGGYYGMGLGNVKTKVGTTTTSATYAASNMKSSGYGALFSLGATLHRLFVEARYMMGMSNMSTVTGTTTKLTDIQLAVGYVF